MRSQHLDGTNALGADKPSWRVWTQRESRVQPGTPSLRESTGRSRACEEDRDRELASLREDDF